MRFDERGILFAPVLPDDLHDLDLTGIPYRRARLDIHITGSGPRVVRMTINGRPALDHRLPSTASAEVNVGITLGQ